MQEQVLQEICEAKHGRETRLPPSGGSRVLRVWSVH